MNKPCCFYKMKGSGDSSKVMRQFPCSNAAIAGRAVAADVLGGAKRNCII